MNGEPTVGSPDGSTVGPGPAKERPQARQLDGASDYDASVLSANLTAFVRGLRKIGFSCGLDAVSDLEQALAAVGWRNPRMTEAAVCALLAQRAEQLPVLVEAWRQFLLALSRRTPPWLAQETFLANVARQATRKHRHPQVAWLGTGEKETSEIAEGTTAGLVAQTGASREERLREMDFAKLTADERAEMERWRPWLGPLYLPTRRSRVSHAGHRIDLRRVWRQLASSEEVWTLPRRRSRLTERPVVWLCDASGSMDPYSRFHLRFAFELLRAGVDLEVFLFSTRLTRVTRDLQVYDFDHALHRISTAAPDFAGGTRLQTALADFLRLHAKQHLRNGAVFLLSSDGLDSDPLDRELGADGASVEGGGVDGACVGGGGVDGGRTRLELQLNQVRRLTSRMIWVNPAAGDFRYEPTAQAASVLSALADDQMPGHSWETLEAVWQHLQACHRTRPLR